MLFPRFQAFLYALTHMAVRSLRSDSGQLMSGAEKGKKRGQTHRDDLQPLIDRKIVVLVKVCCHLDVCVNDFATLGLSVQPHIVMNA